MYEELIRNLRICQDGEHCDRCEFYALKMANGLNACTEALCKQAADAIEKQSAYAKLYEELTDKGQKTARKLLDIYPKWISVGERLPDNEDYVLVCIHSRWNKEICIPLVAYYDRFCSQWKLSWDNSDIYNITHWMPLPEPPKEE